MVNSRCARGVGNPSPGEALGGPFRPTAGGPAGSAPTRLGWSKGRPLVPLESPRAEADRPPSDPTAPTSPSPSQALPRTPARSDPSNLSPPQGSRPKSSPVYGTSWTLLWTDCEMPGGWPPCWAVRVPAAPPDRQRLRARPPGRSTPKRPRSYGRAPERGLLRPGRLESSSNVGLAAAPSWGRPGTLRVNSRKLKIEDSCESSVQPERIGPGKGSIGRAGRVWLYKIFTLSVDKGNSDGQTAENRLLGRSLRLCAL